LPKQTPDQFADVVNSHRFATRPAYVYAQPPAGLLKKELKKEI
jgi:hypothetical protein